MHKFTLTLFGGFHLADASGKPLTPATRKAKALLAWLALNPAREHLREKLAAMFWPDSDEAQARHSLRQTLVELHKIMPETAGVLHTTRETVLLDEQELAVDALEFNAALAQGDGSALDHAISLYQGELLEGCNPRSDIFDDWLSSYRNDYSVRAVITIRQRLTDLLAQQDYEAAILAATRLLAIDPLQEPAYRVLMQANARRGDAAAALLWYQRCQRVLQHELGVAPSPETQALHARLSASRDTPQEPPPQPAPPAQCGCPRHDTAPDSGRRVLCLLKTALQGIVCNGLGHSFLIRGGTRQQKSSLVDNILTMASLQRFTCQHHTLPTADSAGQQTLLPHQQGSEARPTLLLVEHIHRADRATLESLANLISAAGSSSTLLVMTSCLEGEPLDPIWRGAMRGAPLTTVDL